MTDYIAKARELCPKKLEHGDMWGMCDYDSRIYNKTIDDCLPIVADLLKQIDELKEFKSELEACREANTQKKKRIQELENSSQFRRVEEQQLRIKELEEQLRLSNIDRYNIEKHVAELMARMGVPEIAEIVSKKLDSPLKVVDQDNNDTYTNGNSYRFLVSESIAEAIVKHLRGA